MHISRYTLSLSSLLAVGGLSAKQITCDEEMAGLLDDLKKFVPKQKSVLEEFFGRDETRLRSYIKIENDMTEIDILKELIEHAKLTSREDKQCQECVHAYLKEIFFAMGR